MPSPSRLARAVRHPLLPRRTRAGLLRLELARRVRRRAAYALHRAGDDLPLARGLRDRLGVLAFVAVDEAYAGDYRGAVVVDVGAHKGHYGAYALSDGARAVVSYEPESANLAFLERSAAAVRARGGEWLTRRCAVAAEAGEADLHVMGASWGHALHPPEAFAEHEVGLEHVRIDALADVLADAVNLARGDRVIVKVNIEGEECPTILGTRTSAWDEIDDLYVETHPWASCGARELALHLEAAGLSRGRARIRPSCGCSEQETLEPLDVPVPAELRLNRRAGAHTERARLFVVSQHVGERPPESGGIPRRDEPHVVTVLSP